MRMLAKAEQSVSRSGTGADVRKGGRRRKVASIARQVRSVASQQLPTAAAETSPLNHDLALPCGVSPDAERLCRIAKQVEAHYAAAQSQPKSDALQRNMGRTILVRDRLIRFQSTRL